MSSSTVFYLVVLVLALAAMSEGVIKSSIKCTRTGVFKITDPATQCIHSFRVVDEEESYIIENEQLRVTDPSEGETLGPTTPSTSTTSSTTPNPMNSTTSSTTPYPMNTTTSTVIPPGNSTASPGNGSSSTTTPNPEIGNGTMTSTSPTTPGPGQSCHYYICIYYPRFNRWTLSTHSCRKHPNPKFVAEFDESRRACVYRQI